jgi:acyl-CoA thioester hydrolase
MMNDKFCNFLIINNLQNNKKAIYLNQQFFNLPFERQVFNFLIDTMYVSETQIRVRYGETDQMGYLYYGNYALYYEVGRVELLRSLGLTYKEMEETYGVMMPVMSLQMRFVRPALYDELLTVRTTIRHMPTEAITFYVEILNEKKKLVNGGSVKLCFVDMKTNKTIPPPQYLAEKFAAFF